jgi:hypothetical protein
MYGKLFIRNEGLGGDCAILKTCKLSWKYGTNQFTYINFKF